MVFQMIKIIACLLMLVDHIGLVFFPEVIELRLIGRISMPLFAFSLANGIHYTLMRNSFERCLKRMVVFALVSQVPYMLMVGGEIKGNIGFLWIACMVFLYYSNKNPKSFSDISVMYACILFLAFVPVDYGLYGFGFVLMIYYHIIESISENKLYLSYFALHALRLLQDYQSGIIQLFTLPSIPLMRMLSKYDNIKLNKYFFYVFYPLHMAIIVIIKFLVSR